MSRKLRKVDIEEVFCKATSAPIVPGHQEPQSSKQASQAFRYTPLRDVDEIRLLKITPKTKGRHNGALKAAIHHVYLSESPLYTAVSWMWGPRQDLVDLEVNGRVLRIQANLGRIIRDLQDDYQARNLWIDAICIDQGASKSEIIRFN